MLKKKCESKVMLFLIMFDKWTNKKYSKFCGLEVNKDILMAMVSKYVSSY